VPIIHGGAKVVAILEYEVGGIASGSGVLKRSAESSWSTVPVAYISCA